MNDEHAVIFMEIPKNRPYFVTDYKQILPFRGDLTGISAKICKNANMKMVFILTFGEEWL